MRPCAREALEAWLAEGGWGNPSSVHASGRRAQEIVETARVDVAAWLGTRPSRIVFTSGATEANNMAVQAWACRDPRRPLLVSSALEHPSVHEPMVRLEPRHGLAMLPARRRGDLDLAPLDALDPGAIGLLACMAANNETGARLPWRELGAWGSERGVPVHVDLTQVASQAGLELDRSGIASASLSGHKLGALSGCGVLWCREDLEPLLHGGPQERDRRAGTENLAGIVSLGAVARWLRTGAAEEAARVAELGARLRAKVGALPGVEFGIDQELALSHVVHLRLPVDAEAVLIRLDMAGVCASMGSACSAGALEPSRVLLAMGWSREEAWRALRLSLGWSTTAVEVDSAAALLGQILSELASSAVPGT